MFCFRVVDSFDCACLLVLRVIVYAFAFVCSYVLHVRVLHVCVVLMFFVCLLVRVGLFDMWLCM